MARHEFSAARMKVPDAPHVTVPVSSPDRYQTVLEEDFPRVLDAIRAMWGYQALNTYFLKLTMDERGDRVGFPTEAWEDIYMLCCTCTRKSCRNRCFDQFPIQCAKSLSLLLYPLPSMPHRQPT